MNRSRDVARSHVLIVDDDADVRSVLREILAPHYVVSEAASADEAMGFLESRDPDVVLLDLNLGDGPDGFSVLDRLGSLDLEIPVIVLSADRETDTVVRAMKSGASHYIGKTPRYDELLERLRLALDERRRAFQLRSHRALPQSTIVGSSRAMRELHGLVDAAASSDIPVLILGETGTGKGLVARTIHRRSARGVGPFLDVNVAGIQSEILDSEMFGHERGAFTGADRMRRGLFELASEGSTLLDEIGDLPPASQVKLLKVVEDRTIRRVGGNRDIRTDIRVMAATHQDPQAILASGAFRRDLFHRLAGLVVSIPPLRERPEDIPDLAASFLGPSVRVSTRAMDSLRGRSWPGNVRELQQTLRCAALFAGSGTIEEEHVLRAVPLRDPGLAGEQHLLGMPYQDASVEVMAGFRRRYVEGLLARCGGNISLAARESGLSRAHLHELIRQLGLSRPPFPK